MTQTIISRCATCGKKFVGNKIRLPKDKEYYAIVQTVIEPLGEEFSG